MRSDVFYAAVGEPHGDELVAVHEDVARTADDFEATLLEKNRGGE